MSDRCPTCGVPVIVHTSDEGTGYYEPASVALYEAARTERNEAVTNCARLEQERESAREGEDTFKAERDARQAEAEKYAEQRDNQRLRAEDLRRVVDEVKAERDQQVKLRESVEVERDDKEAEAKSFLAGYLAVAVDRDEFEWTEHRIPGRTWAEEEAAANWLGWPVGLLRLLRRDSAVAEAFRILDGWKGR